MHSFIEVGFRQRDQGYFSKIMKDSVQGFELFYYFSLSFESLCCDDHHVVMMLWKHISTVHPWVRRCALHVVPAPPVCQSLACLTFPSNWSVGRKMMLAEAERMMSLLCPYVLTALLSLAGRGEVLGLAEWVRWLLDCFVAWDAEVVCGAVPPRNFTGQAQETERPWKSVSHLKFSTKKCFSPRQIILGAQRRFTETMQHLEMTQPLCVEGYDRGGYMGVRAERNPEARNLGKGSGNIPRKRTALGLEHYLLGYRGLRSNCLSSVFISLWVDQNILFWRVKYSHRLHLWTHVSEPVPHWTEGLALSIVFSRLTAETPAVGWHMMAHTLVREQACMWEEHVSTRGFHTYTEQQGRRNGISLSKS